MGIGIFVILAVDTKLLAGYATNDLNNALAWFILSFAIFNFYMLLGSLRVNFAVFSVFLTLQATEVVLAIAYWNLAHGGSAYILHVGGWIGVVTAGVAWYTSAAGVINGVSGRVVLPVGGPLITESRVAATA